MIRTGTDKGETDMHDLLQRLFQYKAWANDALLTAVAGLAAGSQITPLAIRALSHTHVVDRIFAAQDQWNTQATDNPLPFFEKYASDIGLDVKAWRACFDSRKHQGRISANIAEGERRQVNSTPTFFIGNKAYPGAIPYDMIKAIVDSLTPKAAAQ